MDEQDLGDTPAEGAGSSGIGVGAEGASTGASTRVQNLVHLVPVDWSGVGSLIGPFLERVEPGSGETRLLVLTDDSTQALAVSESVVEHGVQGETGGILPVTSVKRATRILTEKAPAAVVCAATDARALIASSALRLHGLRTLVLAWPHEMLAGADAASALESVLAEVPKDAARVVLASGSSEQLESFLERYMRRARRVEERGSAPALPRQVEFMSTGSRGRARALQVILEEADPATVIVRAPDANSMESAAGAVRLLGLGSHESVRVLSEDSEGDAELVVLYGLPSSREVLAALLESGGGRVVVLLEPREVSGFRRLAGDQARAYVSSAVARNARSRQAGLLSELEHRLRSESFDGEVLGLAPLMESRDPVELAAALLRMLADERGRVQGQGEAPRTERAARPAGHAAAPGTAPSTGRAASASDEAGQTSGWTRVFINVGERDGASPGDLVGAITGEAGVKRDVIGRIDFRDRFSIVEIARDVAEQVIERITGATVRGRQVNAREDRGGDERPRGDRPGGRPSFGRPAGDRGPRGSGGSGDRGGRGGGFSRGGDRGGRSGGFSRGSDRGDVERPRRSFDRGGRPAGRDEGRFSRDSGAGRGPGDRSGRPSRGSDRSGAGGDRSRRFGGDGNRERDRGYGRTQDDERTEWRLRGERLRRSRATPHDRTPRREDPER